MALFEVPPTAYRTRFFLDLLSALLWPFSVTYLVLKVFLPVPSYLEPLAYLASLPVWTVLDNQYMQWRDNSIARAHGAHPIPRVRGRLPGNFDVMRRMTKDLREGYVMQVFSDLLDEHQCNTLNLRLLGKDFVRFEK